MKLQSVFDDAFRPYGRVLCGLDTVGLLVALHAQEKPKSSVRYVPSCPALEADGVCAVLQNSVYGGMPIQIGYCGGTNTRLNCMEYHRDSEVNITEDEMILLVARQQELVDGALRTDAVEAFCVPAGAAVELYATTLHYAPCDARRGGGFRVAVVLPRGTNESAPAVSGARAEDALLWAKNKWLLAHADSDEARQGAHVGLFGSNPDIAADIEGGCQ